MSFVYTDKKKQERKRYYAKHKEKIKKRIENNRLKKAYGLSLEQRDQLIKKQENKCAICLKQSLNTLNIDHCHKTGKVRELLCNPCNQALGYAKESIETLQQMIKYLQKHKEI